VSSRRSSSGPGIATRRATAVPGRPGGLLVRMNLVMHGLQPQTSSLRTVATEPSPRRRTRCGFGFTAHERRRTAATLMPDAGVLETIIPKILNHKEAGVTRRHYNLHAYRNEKRAGAWSVGEAPRCHSRRRAGRDGHRRAVSPLIISSESRPGFGAFYHGRGWTRRLPCYRRAFACNGDARSVTFQTLGVLERPLVRREHVIVSCGVPPESEPAPDGSLVRNPVPDLTSSANELWDIQVVELGFQELQRQCKVQNGRHRSLPRETRRSSGAALR